MPNLLTISQFTSVLHNVVGPANTKEVTWEAFAQAMRKFEVLKDKKKGKAWSPVRFGSLSGYTPVEDTEDVDTESGEVTPVKRWKNPTGDVLLVDTAGQVLRKDVNVRQVYMAVLDLDHMQKTPEELLAPWKGYNYIFHTTYSHAPGAVDEKGAPAPDNRYRLILPLAEPVSAEEFTRIWPVLFDMSGGLADKKCKNLSRLFFMPAHHPDREKEAFCWVNLDGKPLSVSKKAIAAVEKAEKKAVAASAVPTVRNRTPYGQRGDYRTLDGVGWFQAHGMFLGPAGAPNKYFVKCPWQNEHTGQKMGPTDAFLIEDPGRWPTFTCSHTHCDGRDIRQVNEIWGDIDSYCKEKMAPAKIKAQLQSELKISVRCLGYDGESPKRYWYQCSETDSLTRLRADQHKKMNLWSITGDMDYWFVNFGDDEGKINWEAAALFFINQGNKVGPIRPEIAMRGLGVCEDAGRVVAHLGRTLLVDGATMPITKIKSAFIYERSFPEIKLTGPASLAEAGKVFRLIDRLSIPKESERVLLAGQIVAGYLCGIFEYRPHCWLVGMPDSGKSATMREVVAKLWTPVGGIFREEKTTAAGIRQTLEKNSVPVAIDEAEAHGKDEINRIAQLVTIARSATSSADAGGTGQGSPGGRAMSFKVRSSFIFASISPGLLTAQDKQRFSIINFRANAESAKTWKAFQRELRETLTDEFAARFYHRAIKLTRTVQKSIDVFYNVILEKVPTASSRFANHIGTLLACAYTYFSDEAATAETAWAFYDKLGDWEDYRLEGFEENNAHQAYGILMTHQIQDGIHRKTIAELIEESMRPDVLKDDSGKILRRFGLRVDVEKKRIFVANRHPTLDAIMQNHGILRHNVILREYPGAVKHDDPMRLDTSSSTYRGIWLPYQGENDAKLPAAPSSLAQHASDPTRPEEDPSLAF